VILNLDGTWRYAPTSTPAGISVDAGFDCSALLTEDYDEVTGRKTTRVTDAIVLSDDNTNGVVLNVFRSDASGYFIFFMFKVVDEGKTPCFDKSNRLYLLFTDGSRQEYYNGADFNCDGTFYFTVSINAAGRKLLKEFQEKQLKTIRLVGYKGESFQRDFDQYQAAYLNQAVGCMARSIEK